MSLEIVRELAPRLLDLCLFGMILATLYTDIRWRRIPNALTASCALTGLLLNSMGAGLQDFVDSLGGMLLGIGLLFIPFMMGGVGGGDVKFLGAVGALRGVHFVFQATVAGAIVGGLMALIALVRSGRLLAIFRRILWNVGAIFVRHLGFVSVRDTDEEHPASIPYGVALAFGAAWALMV